MEDRATASRLPWPGFLRLAAAFDGHVGDGCAEYAKKNAVHLLLQQPEFGAGDYATALARTLEAAHTNYLREAAPSDQSGAVATLALLVDGQLHVAAVGNCSCVVGASDGRATLLAGGPDKRHEIPHRGFFGQEQAGAEKKTHKLGAVRRGRARPTPLEWARARRRAAGHHA